METFKIRRSPRRDPANAKGNYRVPEPLALKQNGAVSLEHFSNLPQKTFAVIPTISI